MLVIHHFSNVISNGFLSSTRVNILGESTINFICSDITFYIINNLHYLGFDLLFAHFFYYYSHSLKAR